LEWEKVANGRMRALSWASKMTDTGYSGTPLWKKLGFKTGMKVMVLNAPSHYASLFNDSANDWLLVKKSADAIHLFITETKQLSEIEKLSKLMPPAIMLWVSWPKKSSPLSKGLSEDHIRKAAITCGLVDIKVCALDQDWSGLKLTRRRT
jgi:hypothetical protein